MLSLALITLVTLVTSPFLRLPEANAYNNHDAPSPALWLTTLRNATGTTAPLVNGPGIRSIRFSAGAAPITITEAEKYELEKTNLRYFDVTENDPDATRAEQLGVDRFPTGPVHLRHQHEVKEVIATLSIDNLKTDLAALTAYNNRYYRAATGVQAANDLVTKLKTIASAAPGTGGVISVNAFTHSFPMPSVIGRIEGTDPTAPVVIVGAHLDSIDLADPMKGFAPGSDKDGSGAVNLIESFRKLTAAGFKPANPVEFHWYAAEEGGLMGSTAIATAYANKRIKVKGMLQLHMTAYVYPGTSPIIGLITDNTDPALTFFTKTLVKTYLNGLFASESECGYACSDHESWDRVGYASAMAFESNFELGNPAIYGRFDLTTVKGFDWAHCHEYTKLAVAFLMELSLPEEPI